MRFPRSSGILLPVTSLPGRFGIGDFGPEAYRFVDFLQAAGQTIWQLLPLGPTTRGNSPYSSYSAFAGNPLLISPELLCDAGLLTNEQLSDVADNGSETDRVDYATATATKCKLLTAAFAKFRRNAAPEFCGEFDQFRETQHSWLHDFARFDALRGHFADPDWSRWGTELVRRDSAAVEGVDRRLSNEIAYSKFMQFLFARQWSALKAYANQRGVRIYGDMPIFVAYESVDVWINQHLFSLGDEGRPTFVAGVPPDYFSETGQMWGNPLYRWDRLADSNYDWWTQRIRHALDSFDILRIDHFRGFESYWEIPATAENAVSGNWREGPRDAPFCAARDALGELPIVAEDLGLITDDVHALRDRLGFPGMRVLQFGFYHEDDPYHRPECYPENSVAYTGTHDNETLMGWYHQQMADPRNEILHRLVPEGDPEPHFHLIQAVLNSAAETTILPLQDLLGLGNEAKMNTPGLPEGNWEWRCHPQALNNDLSARLRSMTERSSRLALGFSD